MQSAGVIILFAPFAHAQFSLEKTEESLLNDWARQGEDYQARWDAQENEDRDREHELWRRKNYFLHQSEVRAAKDQAQIDRREGRIRRADEPWDPGKWAKPGEKPEEDNWNPWGTDWSKTDNEETKRVLRDAGEGPRKQSRVSPTPLPEGEWGAWDNNQAAQGAGSAWPPTQINPGPRVQGNQQRQSKLKPTDPNHPDYVPRNAFEAAMLESRNQVHAAVNYQHPISNYGASPRGPGGGSMPRPAGSTTGTMSSSKRYFVPVTNPPLAKPVPPKDDYLDRRPSSPAGPAPPGGARPPLPTDSSVSHVLAELTQRGHLGPRPGGPPPPTGPSPPTGTPPPRLLSETSFNLISIPAMAMTGLFLASRVAFTRQMLHDGLPHEGGAFFIGCARPLLVV